MTHLTAAMRTRDCVLHIYTRLGNYCTWHAYHPGSLIGPNEMGEMISPVGDILATSTASPSISHRRLSVCFIDGVPSIGTMYCSASLLL